MSMEIMNSSEMYCTKEADVSRGCQELSIAESSDKIGVVSKSKSLQEVTSRSLNGVFDSESSEIGMNSSGVFSCSVDISDVCMGDLTKLSDSTLCSSTNSVNRLQSDRDDVSTPLPRVPNSSILSPALTPIRSQTDSLLTPLLGFSDEYFGRNIKFLSTQLKSLMTQLQTEDKHFQNCISKYEDIIENLKTEKLESNSEYTHKINQLLEECKGKDDRIAQLQQELSVSSNQEAINHNDIGDSKPLAEFITQLHSEFIPPLREIVQTVQGSFPESDFNISLIEGDSDQRESRDLKWVVSFLKMTISHLNKAVSFYVRGNSNLSKNLQQALSTVEELKNQSDGNNEAVSQLNKSIATKTEIIRGLDGKVNQLQSEIDSLQSESSASKIELSGLKIENDGLKRELNVIQKQHSSILEKNQLLDAENIKLNHEVSKLTEELKSTNHKLIECQRDLDSVKSDSTNELTKANIEIQKLVDQNSSINHIISTKEIEITKLLEKCNGLDITHKMANDDLSIKNSALILENSKLKDVLEVLQRALDEAKTSAEKNTEKFNELQMLYSSLNGAIASKETAFNDLEKKSTKTESILKAKESILRRLYSNFNELLSIFRECHGLDQNSSMNDIDDGFIRLKKRLLDLSQDYITLNSRNKVLEKELAVATGQVQERETELSHLNAKFDNKMSSLQRTLEKIEAENKQIVSKKIDLEDEIKTLTEKIVEFELCKARSCLDCGVLTDQLQQLQISIVDKDATISTLELHIRSCCEYNRKKAQQYKHDLHVYKRQFDAAHTSYANDFGFSPKKSKASMFPKIDVSTQAGESFLHPLTGGFVERFKIRDLEERVVKLEKEKTVLKRLCRMRSDRIQELETQTKVRESPSSLSLK